MRGPTEKTTFLVDGFLYLSLFLPVSDDKKKESSQVLTQSVDSDYDAWQETKLSRNSW